MIPRTHDDGGKCENGAAGKIETAHDQDRRMTTDLLLAIAMTIKLLIAQKREYFSSNSAEIALRYGARARADAG